MNICTGAMNENVHSEILFNRKVKVLSNKRNWISYKLNWLQLLALVISIAQEEFPRGTQSRAGL